ncbi:MAG: hypothetical protein PHR16_11600 [Methylovulum sp.]|nr:hypothetical protein [Methylovulum sp.]
MSDEINKLFELNDADARQSPCGSIIKLCSLPIAITACYGIIAFLLSYLHVISSSGFYEFQWLLWAISLLASSICAIYGLWHWNVLTGNQKLVVLLHALFIISLLMLIAYLIFRLSSGPMKW